MNSIKLITLSPSQFHILSLVAHSQGQTVEEFTSHLLSKLIRGLAELQAPPRTETPESLAALPPVLSTAGQGANAGQGTTPAPATTTGHPASTPAYPPAAPVDTAAALAHFGLTL